ncbi:cyclin-T1 [Trichonephila clavipes]|nr:cyclin-T1 [Trichonephila clavipes]
MLPIITAAVYIHRFYMVRDFEEAQRNDLCLAALFLAAKVHDQHMTLEQIIKGGNYAAGAGHMDMKSESYSTKMKSVLFHEEILLSALGFCIDVIHPHPFVMLVCQNIKASEELLKASYEIATLSIINTTLCLTFSPKAVACICIHAACKIFDYKVITN